MDNQITVILNPFGANRNRMITSGNWEGKKVGDVIAKYWVSDIYECVSSINGELVDADRVIRKGENVVILPKVEGGGGGKDVL